MKMKNVSGLVSLSLILALLVGCGGSQRPPESSAGPPSYSESMPADAQSLVQQAELAQKANNFTQAISLWERIIQKYPNNAVAARGFATVGNIYLAQGQAERALQYFDYLVYTYPRWEGLHQTQLDRLKALVAAGKKKQAMREAVPLWDASSAQPDVLVGLAVFMSGLYGADGDVDTGFSWVSVGFAHASTPDEKKLLTQSALDLLKNIDESGVKKLNKKNTSDFMRVFLDFRLAQLEMQKGQQEPARESLRRLLNQNPGHPLLPEIQAALRGSRPEGPALALNPDRIGVLVPLNGSYAKYGEMVMKGLSLASADWSEMHSGQRISLDVKDAQADSDAAIKSFEELVKKDGALAVVGPLGAQAAKAVTPLANKWGVPVLALTQKEDEQTDNSFVVHIFLDNRELVRTLVKYCREKLGYTRFATLYPDDRYGQKLSKIFAEEVQQSGGNLLASVSYKEKTTDFKDPIQKLMNIAKKNAPPSGVETTPFDAIFLPDQVQTVSLIAPQLPYYNVVGVTLLGTNLWSEAPLVQSGGVYMDQAIFPTAYYAESQSPRSKAFRERYEAKYNAPPSYLEAQAYDALMMVLQARNALRSGSADRASLLQTLMTAKDFEGVAGVYSFTPQGDLDRNYTLLQVQNGQLVQITP